jgi:hypothetical protein
MATPTRNPHDHIKVSRSARPIAIRRTTAASDGHPRRGRKPAAVRRRCRWNTLDLGVMYPFPQPLDAAPMQPQSYARRPSRAGSKKRITPGNRHRPIVHPACDGVARLIGPRIIFLPHAGGPAPTAECNCASLQGCCCSCLATNPSQQPRRAPRARPSVRRKFSLTQLR